VRNAYLTTLGVLAALATVAALATLVLPGWAPGATAGDDGNGRKFEARLTGEQEVTTPPGGVDTETRGKAEFKFNRDRNELRFELEVKDGERVTQAHIHCAPAGSNGPIIIFLGGFHDRGWDVDGDWIGDATATDANITNTACGATLAEIAEAMAAGNTYANVHTTANPGGEVRGQIHGEDDDDDNDDNDDD
jgi:hypothetical protein